MKSRITNVQMVSLAIPTALIALLGVWSLAVAAVTPSVTATIQNGSNAGISSADIGTAVHATAMVASSTASTSPTGTVDFNRYDNLNCSDSPDTQTNVSLTGGLAQSATTTLPASGLSYKVHYDGQADLYTEADSACISLTAIAPQNPPATPGTISGTLYNDLNGNDTQDSGEPGLGGWHVWLHEAATSSAWWKSFGKKHDGYDAPIIAIATTDSNGNYSFSNLALGSYFVEEEEQSGWNQTSDDTKVTLKDSDSSGDVDFSNVQNGQGNDGEDNDNDTDNDGHHGHATSTDNGNHSHGDKDKGKDNRGDNGNHFGWFKNIVNHIGGWGKHNKDD